MGRRNVVEEPTPLVVRQDEEPLLPVRRLRERCERVAQMNCCAGTRVAVADGRRSGARRGRPVEKSDGRELTGGGVFMEVRAGARKSGFMRRAEEPAGGRCSTRRPMTPAAARRSTIVSHVNPPRRSGRSVVDRAARLPGQQVLAVRVGRPEQRRVPVVAHEEMARQRAQYIGRSSPSKYDSAKQVVAANPARGSRVALGPSLRPNRARGRRNRSHGTDCLRRVEHAPVRRRRPLPSERRRSGTGRRCTAN